MTHFIRTAIAAQYSIYNVYAYILEPVVSVKYWDYNLHAAPTFMFCKLENSQRQQRDAWAEQYAGEEKTTTAQCQRSLYLPSCFWRSTMYW